MEEFSFLTEEPEGIIKFDEVEVDKDKIYKVLLMNFFKPDTFKSTQNTTYLVFRGRLIKGYDHLEQGMGRTYIIHFPLASFRYAWGVAPNYQKTERGVVYDCIITFQRTSKKKIRILDRVYLKAGIYNEESVVE